MLRMLRFRIREGKKLLLWFLIHAARKIIRLVDQTMQHCFFLNLRLFCMKILKWKHTGIYCRTLDIFLSYRSTFKSEFFYLIQ
jgi:hypothetical protein